VRSSGGISEYLFQGIQFEPFLEIKANLFPHPFASLTQATKIAKKSTWSASGQDLEGFDSLGASVALCEK
jgi:hypothetical protein